MAPAPRWDAILLDVDNGPDGIVRDANDRLYTRTGLGKARSTRSIPAASMAVWSAAPDPAFTRRLYNTRMAVEKRTVRARPEQQGGRSTRSGSRRGASTGSLSFSSHKAALPLATLDEVNDN